MLNSPSYYHRETPRSGHSALSMRFLRTLMAVGFLNLAGGDALAQTASHTPDQTIKAPAKTHPPHPKPRRPKGKPKRTPKPKPSINIDGEVAYV